MTPPVARQRPLRVLHCPWNIAGHSAMLAAAERRLGLDSRCVAVFETAQGFPADQAMTHPAAGRLALEAARWRLFWRAIRWADVVHFTFGQSILVPHAFPDFRPEAGRSPAAWLRRAYARLLWYADLPLLARMGKRIAVTWQGDDARQRDRSLELFDISIAAEVDEGYYPPGSDRWKRRAIARFGRHAHAMWALNPDLLHVLPPAARFMPYASLEIAAFAPLPASPGAASRTVRIVHAPSHRGAKGTHHVIAAVAALSAEGLMVELDLVEGVPRDEVLRRIASADLIVDQLLAGWYGGFAVEAMALGRPVVCAIRRGDLRFVPPALAHNLPVVEAWPDTLCEVLRDLVSGPRERLAALGAAGRRYVEQWHDPDLIARETAASYAKT